VLAPMLLLAFVSRSSTRLMTTRAKRFQRHEGRLTEYSRGRADAACSRPFPWRR
jgi:hypothetical protein